MAASLRSVRKLPVLVILGATGSGKSKLAIELASRFNGEIISTDSMQVYKGLDIVTNKVTCEEQAACCHHMIAYLEPLHSQHTVTDFRNRALPVIDRLHQENKLPIIVGGTNYYIESLLWKCLIDTKEHGPEFTEATIGNLKAQQPAPTDHQPPPTDHQLHQVQSLRSVWSDWTSAALHDKLMELDAEKARSIHRNDRRKIIRAVEVYQQHGVRMSEILAQQHSEPGAGQLSGPLRYPNTCILWLQCQQEALDERCNRRVDNMLERGLIDEMHQFHQDYNKQRSTDDRSDYTHGIFQSIGFKEFHSYLLLPEAERQTDLGRAMLKEGVELLKLATRRYARYQVKWIKNRFLKREGDNIPAIYAVDSTYPDKWQTEALAPACSIVEAFLQNKTPSVEPLPRDGESINRVVHMTCDVCDGRLFVREKEWLAHINSRKHKKRMSSARRRVCLEQDVQRHSDRPTDASNG